MVIKNLNNTHSIFILYKNLYSYVTQVTENPSGDFKSMHRHISKGSWTFSDQDHGWQVSDCTAEGLKVATNIRYEQLCFVNKLSHVC